MQGLSLSRKPAEAMYYLLLVPLTHWLPVLVPSKATGVYKQAGGHCHTVAAFERSLPPLLHHRAAAA